MIAVSPGEPLRVLLVKPYQPTNIRVACPPLGLLYLASTLRKTFGSDVEVRLLDLMVDQARYFEAREHSERVSPARCGFVCFELGSGGVGPVRPHDTERVPGNYHRYRRPVCPSEYAENLRDRRLRLDLRRRSGLVFPDRLPTVVSRRQDAGPTLWVLPGAPGQTSHSPITPIF